MSHSGGGAEAHARFMQYEYKANSSLVLTTDSRPRETHEPIAEPETLWGKIDPKSFGDRVCREKLKKSKKDREPGFHVAGTRSKRSRIQEESVLTSSEEGVYQPKTRETRAAYEAMLGVIQLQLGGQPLNIVSGAADEILAVLKNDHLQNYDKKEIEKVLDHIPSPAFDQLVTIGRLITDFHDGGDAVTSGEYGFDNEVGVAVEFEENEEEESDLDMLHEDEEDDDNVTGTMQMCGGIDDDDGGVEANEEID